MTKFLIFSAVIVLSTSALLNSIEDVVLMAKNDMSKYLKATRNCEVSHSSIKKKEESLTKGSRTIRQKAENIYNFVKKNIKYERYANSKYGAVKTLLKGQGNCCDQAHLLVALLRSAQIPARYVHGKGHVWAEGYVDNKWAHLDPTNQKHGFDKPYSHKNDKTTKHDTLPF